jgi:Fe2+ transport system protein FeoA
MLVSVAGDEAVVSRLLALGMEGVPVRIQRLGEVGGDAVAMRIGEREVALTIDRAREAYERGLPEALS